MTILATLAGVSAYAVMRDVGRPFALAFAMLTVVTVPVIGLG